MKRLVRFSVLVPGAGDSRGRRVRRQFGRRPRAARSHHGLPDPSRQGDPRRRARHHGRGHEPRGRVNTDSVGDMPRRSRTTSSTRRDSSRRSAATRAIASRMIVGESWECVWTTFLPAARSRSRGRSTTRRTACWRSPAAPAPTASRARLDGAEEPAGGTEFDFIFHLSPEAQVEGRAGSAATGTPSPLPHSGQKIPPCGNCMTNSPQAEALKARSAQERVRAPARACG